MNKIQNTNLDGRFSKDGIKRKRSKKSSSPAKKKRSGSRRKNKKENKKENKKKNIDGDDEELDLNRSEKHRQQLQRTSDASRNLTSDCVIS